MVNMNGGRIGFTGARVGHTMLKTPLQDGIDTIGLRSPCNHTIIRGKNCVRRGY